MWFLIEEIPAVAGPARASAAARRVLASLLARHCGVTQLPPIVALPSGKPVFGQMDGLHFSLSHCRRAVMAVVDTRPVGCDIEDIAGDVDDGLLSVAFDSREQEYIRKGKDPFPGRRTDYTPAEVLAAIWTRKEASVKRLGDIPDNPADWPSDSPGLTTRIVADRGYAFSIAVSI